MVFVSDAGKARKAESAKLPLLRFEDLSASGIVKTWQTLKQVDRCPGVSTRSHDRPVPDLDRARGYAVG